jgi:hypothetical protein
MKTRLGLAALGLFSSMSIPAQNLDIPVSNWTVPPYTQTAATGLRPMQDITWPLPFVAVEPCRVVDTRRVGGPYGGPFMTAFQQRTFRIPGGPCPGIPGDNIVVAYSLNFGAILPPADGYLTAWSGNSGPPQVSQLNMLAGEVVANAAIVAGNAFGDINVLVNVGPTHIYIDINGYFSSENMQDAPFFLKSSIGATLGPDAPLTYTAAIYGRLNGSGWDPTTTAVSGANGGAGQGVRGVSSTGYGVQGISSTTYNSAGVQGQVVYPAAPLAGFNRAGVRGDDTTGFGVLGVSETTGAAGYLVSSATIVASGALGTSFGTDPDGGGPPWGVHAVGNIGATGTKAFLEPHPTDPTKVIQFIALEGPEAGTYFRGRGRFQRGLARIPVPEEFRMVTDAEGLTVQVTPIGGMASFGVVRMDLNEIVVQGSRDLEFSYLVQGVRASFKGEPTILRDGTFLPRSPEDRMPAGLAERQKRLLVANGTYNEDGTVNMETARRRGWTEMWERRRAERAAAGPESP